MLRFQRSRFTGGRRTHRLIEIRSRPIPLLRHSATGRKKSLPTRLCPSGVGALRQQCARLNDRVGFWDPDGGLVVTGERLCPAIKRTDGADAADNRIDHVLLRLQLCRAEVEAGAKAFRVRQISFEHGSNRAPLALEQAAAMFGAKFRPVGLDLADLVRQALGFVAQLDQRRVGIDLDQAGRGDLTDAQVISRLCKSLTQSIADRTGSRATGTVRRTPLGSLGP